MSQFNYVEVSYFDKTDSYKRKVETVEDEDSIRSIGILKRTATARGATDRKLEELVNIYCIVIN